VQPEGAAAARGHRAQGESAAHQPDVASVRVTTYAHPRPPTRRRLQVLRIHADGKARRLYVKRRDLLREHRLQPRDLRRLDPAADPTKTSPSVTIKEDVLLLNLGGARCAGAGSTRLRRLQSQGRAGAAGAGAAAWVCRAVRGTGVGLQAPGASRLGAKSGCAPAPPPALNPPPPPYTHTCPLLPPILACRAIVTAEKALLLEPNGEYSRRFLDLVLPRVQATAGNRAALRSNLDPSNPEYVRVLLDGRSGEQAARSPPFELEVLEGAMIVATGGGGVGARAAAASAVGCCWRKTVLWHGCISLYGLGSMQAAAGSVGGSAARGQALLRSCPKRCRGPGTEPAPAPRRGRPPGRGGAGRDAARVAAADQAAAGDHPRQPGGAAPH
jgi:hypothetical protein